MKNPDSVTNCWKMTQHESQAYQLANIWQTEVQRLFPDMQSFSKLPKKGDPRKSNLFRYCWKLLRETRGLLNEDEYRLYIKANLHILKIHNGHVEPNALCGDKAWYRWLVWKRLYDIKSQQMAGDRLLQEEPRVEPRFFKEVGLTKRFLFEKCEGQPTFDKIQAFFESPKMKMWVSGSKITPYYLVMSPWVSKLCDANKIQEKFQIDPAVYEQKLDLVSRKHFQKEFHYEFSK